MNKKTAAIVNEAAQADRTAAKRARRDQQHTTTWPTAGKATLRLATHATARTEAGDLPVTATALPRATRHAPSRSRSWTRRALLRWASRASYSRSPLPTAAEPASAWTIPPSPPPTAATGPDA
ncbi:hypothetical protein ACFQV4_25640 [Streptomyces thermocarboxydus]